MFYLKMFSLSILLVCAFGCGGRSNALGEGSEFQNFARRITHGNFCANGQIAQEETFAIAPLYFDSVLKRCAIWEANELSGSNVISGNIPLQGWDVPIMLQLKGNSIPTTPPKIHIQVIGGPGEAIYPTKGNKAIAAGMRDGDVLIAFGYAGTVHGSLYPNQSLDTAAAQLRELVAIVSPQSANHSVILIGESLGAIIATQAMDAEMSRNLSQVVFLNPGIMAPRAYAQRLWEDYERRDRSVPTTPFGEAIVMYRPMRSTGGILSLGEWERVNSKDYFFAFFPQDELDLPMASRFGSHWPAQSVTAIFGENDIGSGREEVREFGVACQCRTVTIPGVGHVLKAGDYDKVGEAFRSVLLGE